MSNSAAGATEPPGPAGATVLMSAQQVAQLLRAQEDRANARLTEVLRQLQEQQKSAQEAAENAKQTRDKEKKEKDLKDAESVQVTGIPQLADKEGWAKWRDAIWQAVDRRSGLLGKWSLVSKCILACISAGERAGTPGADGKSPNKNLEDALQALSELDRAHLRAVRSSLRFDGPAHALVSMIPDDDKTLWSIYKKLVRDFGGLSAPAQAALHEKFMTEKYDPTGGPLSVWLASKYTAAVRLSECTPPKLHPDTVDQNMISLITGKLPESFEPVVSQVRTRGFTSWTAAADIVVSYDENLRVTKKAEIGALNATTEETPQTPTTTTQTQAHHVAPNQCRVCQGFGHKSFQCPSAAGNHNNGGHNNNYYNKNGWGGRRFGKGHGGKGGWGNGDKHDNRVRKENKNRKQGGKHGNGKQNENANHPNANGKGKKGKKN